MLYHGIDLIDIHRIEDAATRWGDRFLRRVFTFQELLDCGGRPASLAARWAAKEAAAKALGVGLQGPGARVVVGNQAVGWQEIEVVRGPHGAPQLRLHGAAGQRAATLGWKHIALSLSHTGDLAVASVVALASQET